MAICSKIELEYLSKFERANYPLKVIGKETVREEIIFIPARLENHRHIRYAYAYKPCEERGKTAIIKATVQADCR